MARLTFKTYFVLAIALCATTMTLATATEAQARQTVGSLNVCVFYDSDAGTGNASDPGASSGTGAHAYKAGELYAIMLTNLLGHFDEVKSHVFDVSQYRSGEINGCDRAAYIGSYYPIQLSSAFLSDVAGYSKPLLWMNYGIWQLQNHLGLDQFKSRFGFTFEKLTQYDEASSTDGLPGFYRYFKYKGARFQKYAKRDPVTDKVIASPEIALITVDRGETLATAVDSVTQAETPYVTRFNDFFYIADLPFAYIHENDRYLIAGDVLFDWLKLPPRSTKHYAVARVEDLHPAVPVDELYKTFHIFKRKNLPFALTLIPRFKDLVGYNNGAAAYRDLMHSPAFVKAIQYAQANGASVLLHGVTHQHHENGADCLASASGDDFEFWDGCGNVPLSNDSEAAVEAKLKEAFSLLNQAGITPVGWTTPHYQASDLDYKVFARHFSRTMQRMRYVPFHYDPSETNVWAGQFYAYTIRHDVYGQFIWPEDLGNVQLITNTGDQIRLPEEIIEAARNNLVLRDSWASFFWHPELIKAEIGIRSLTQIIDALQGMGYEFVSLKDLKDHGE